MEAWRAPADGLTPTGRCWRFIADGPMPAAGSVVSGIAAGGSVARGSVVSGIMASGSVVGGSVAGGSVVSGSVVTTTSPRKTWRTKAGGRRRPP